MNLLSLLLIQFQEAKVTKAYHATAAIDGLHACILEGRRREKARHEEDLSSSYPNTWKPNMDPRASVRAHTVPLIRAELERLNHEIAEVRLPNLRPHDILEPAATHD